MSGKKVVSKVQKPSLKPKPVAEDVTQRQKSFKDYLNVFEFDYKLPGSGEILKIKPITIGALKGFLTLDGEVDPVKVTGMFDDLFSEVVLTPDFDPSKMYVYDRYALLLEIRKITKGEKNQFEMTCPECKGQSIQTIDFSKIVSKKRKPDINHFVELTEHLSVKLRFLTRELEMEVYETSAHVKEEEQLSEAQANTELSLMLEAQSIEEIITPEGPQKLDFPLFDKKYLLENIPQPLYEKLNKWHEDNHFGPDLSVEIKCSHCDFKMSEDITDLNLNFFS